MRLGERERGPNSAVHSQPYLTSHKLCDALACIQVCVSQLVQKLHGEKETIYWGLLREFLYTMNISDTQKQGRLSGLQKTQEGLVSDKFNMTWPRSIWRHSWKKSHKPRHRGGKKPRCKGSRTKVNVTRAQYFLGSGGRWVEADDRKFKAISRD